MRGRWIAKAVVQKAISYLPDPQRANYFFQDRVTRSTTLDEHRVHQQVAWAAQHLDAFRRLGRAPEQGFSALELGSGWYPIVPLSYFLAGADRVWMVDLEDLCRPELAVQAVDALAAAHGRGELAALGPIAAERVERLRDVGPRIVAEGHVAALARLGLAITPTDARTLSLPDPPDLISSNTVLEHIDATTLTEILRRFSTIAGEGTVMSHLVDHCDHYAYIDDDVSIYHFLRYSDRAWRLIDNRVQPMNRLRASEYRAIYERLAIPLTEEHLSGCDPSALDGHTLAPRFAEMDPADVACTASHLVSVLRTPT